jgi:hypothetical protein
MGVFNDPTGTFGRHITSLTFVPDILITSIKKTDATHVTITWTGAAQPTFSLESKSPITGAWSTVASGLSGPSTTVLIGTDPKFFRISKP